MFLHPACLQLCFLKFPEALLISQQNKMHEMTAEQTLLNLKKPQHTPIDILEQHKIGPFSDLK